MDRARTEMPHFVSGRGNGVQDYIAFWQDHTGTRHANPVRVLVPPHEHARGSILEDFIIEALRRTVHEASGRVDLLGAMSLYGAERELVLGDGRAAQATLTPDGWRVGHV